MRKRIQRAIVQAAATVHVSGAQARRWFLELERHPERYRFETHGGFAFSEGSFGEVGARFQTWEQFHGLTLSLHFELTEVGDTRFQFRVIRPPLPVWCAFAIGETAEDTTDLRLEVGGTTRGGEWFLRLPPVRSAVERQIRGEVDHIKISMEAWRDLARS